MKRRVTRQMLVRGVKIGGNAPISIQSMTTAKTSCAQKTMRQIKKLAAAGCEIVRVSIKDKSDARALGRIISGSSIPVVADIHFDYRLALEAIERGADKIRINPGNITSPDHIGKIAKAAKTRRTPIRIGVNSGSMPLAKGADAAVSMARFAMRSIKQFEKLKFYDMVISLKSSSVVTTIEAYRILSGRCDYPLHVGVTAAGLPADGAIKSSIGIGSLLFDGIGDTIRVSLTGNPEEEILVAQGILSALGIRRFRPEIISCPMCGRCQVNLDAIVRKVREEVYRLPKARGGGLTDITIAVMGCEVNGPGEAKAVDVGIAAGKGRGVLIRKGRIIRRVKEKDFVKALVSEIKKM